MTKILVTVTAGGVVKKHMGVKSLWEAAALKAGKMGSIAVAN